MARFINDIQEELGITIVLVEHDMGLVMDIADRVLGLDFGQRIAVLAGLSRASVSSAVNTLERAGHVARSREHDDRRMVTVSLTSSGEAAVRDSYREQHEVERALCAGLEEGERAELAHLLESLIDAPLD